MSNGRLVWFRSTEWMSFYVEGQTFKPDDDGYIAVPENLVAQFRHPSLQYVGRERPKKQEELQTAVAVSPKASPTTDAVASRSNVSYAELKAALAAHGNAPEHKLMAYANQVIAQKHVPRQLLRTAREELFGKPTLGAPKRRQTKSPQ